MLKSKKIVYIKNHILNTFTWQHHDNVFKIWFLKDNFLTSRYRHARGLLTQNQHYHLEILFFSLQAHWYTTGCGGDDWRSASPTPPAPPASPAVQRVFHRQPCRLRRELSALSIGSQLSTTTVSLRLCKDKHTKMGKCYGGEPGCDGKARNSKSWCGTCTKAKRARGEKVVNTGSPSNAALSESLKKRPHERSAHEQGMCDRCALWCMSHCTQCLLLCICSIMRRADSRKVIHQAQEE